MIVPSLSLSNLLSSEDGESVDLELRADLDEAIPLVLHLEGCKPDEGGVLRVQWAVCCDLTVLEASALRDVLDVALRMVERHKA